MITTITMKIEHTKPIPDLLDKAAGRVYSMDGVEDVTVTDCGEFAETMRKLIDLAYGK